MNKDVKANHQAQQVREVKTVACDVVGYACHASIHLCNLHMCATHLHVASACLGSGTGYHRELTSKMCIRNGFTNPSKSTECCPVQCICKVKQRAYRQVGEGIASTVARHLSGDKRWVVLQGVPAAQHRLEEPSRPMRICFVGCLQEMVSFVSSLRQGVGEQV